MNYKNQAISEDLFLAEIKLMLISVVVIIVIKGEIKNSEKEGIIYIYDSYSKQTRNLA